ncbi:MAG: hypothetical protein JOZ83_09670 [Silvibacterium sp.]|nr:hypothetical protein [Silvibacterium sp.]
MGEGTLAPSLRASDNPIAIACFGLVTFLPLRPDFSFPSFIARISRSTDLEALGLYLRPLDFFAELFFEPELFFALLLVFFPLLFFELDFLELVFLDGMLAFLPSLRSA